MQIALIKRATDGIIVYKYLKMRRSNILYYTGTRLWKSPYCVIAKTSYIFDSRFQILLVVVENWPNHHIKILYVAIFLVRGLWNV